MNRFFNLQKTIVFSVVFIVLVIFAAFISSSVNTTYAAACYQCKCWWKGAEICSVHAITNTGGCTNTFCRQDGDPCLGWAKSKGGNSGDIYADTGYNPQTGTNVGDYTAECGNNCIDACVNSGGGGGGGDPGPTSCTLSHRAPAIAVPALAEGCAGCIVQTLNWSGVIFTVKNSGYNQSNWSCTNPELVAHLCNGGVTSDPTAHINPCKDAKNGVCAIACGVAAPTVAPTAAPTVAPTAAPVVITTAFRYAENLADLNAAPWRNYTADGMLVNYDFKTPGQKFIFVQFMDSTGKITNATNCPKCQASIRILNADPVITSCLLTFAGNNTTMNLTGQNFGSAKGKAKSNDTDLQIKEWKDTSIKAILPDAPTGETLPIIITNTDGQTADGRCGAISQLSLGAKIFCRAPSSHDMDNVDVILVGKFEGGKKVRQKVKIDKLGIIQGLIQQLEDGKKYMVSLKATRSLRRNAEFTAGGGVTNIPDFVLPVGDIFPADGGDGIINTLDKGELNREWNIAGNATGRAGDFNLDGKVNSIDWACMRYDFSQKDNEEPEPGVPTVSPSPSATATFSTSPSPVCSPRPACLDLGRLACKIPEPAAGWCPSSSPTSASGVCEHAAAPVNCYWDLNKDIYPYCEAPLICASASVNPGSCIQVVTPAQNPATGECRDFPTPCDVPAGWQVVSACGTNI